MQALTQFIQPALLQEIGYTRLVKFFELFSDEFSSELRSLLATLTATAQDSNPIASLLLDVYVVFAISGAGRMFSRELVEGLAQRSDGRPWAEVRRGKEINELWLAQQLKPYGIRPRTIWVGDSQAKGYYFEDFKEASQRYIPKAEAQAFLAELKGPKPNSDTPSDGSAEPPPK